MRACDPTARQHRALSDRLRRFGVTLTAPAIVSSAMKLAALMLSFGALSAGVFGQTATPDSPRRVCLFLDLNSMSPAEQAKAQETAAQFIQDKAAPSDLIEIATFTSKFNVVQGFTGDRDSLLAAIKNLKPAQIDADSSGRMEAIQAATGSLAQLPGDAGLVYITTPAGSPSYMAAASALRFAANPQQPIGVSLLPIQR